MRTYGAHWATVARWEILASSVQTFLEGPATLCCLCSGCKLVWGRASMDGEKERERKNRIKIEGGAGKKTENTTVNSQHIEYLLYSKPLNVYLNSQKKVI